MAIIAKLRERHRGRPGRERRLRYVQTLPTLCTLANLICGFWAIHLCLRAMLLAGANQNPADVNTMNSALLERMLPSHVVMAAYLIFVAMIFDALDGRLARWTRHTTDFGAQLDSLADVVSFGVVPPLLVITLLTRQLSAELVVAPFSESIVGRMAWFMAAVYAACAALRLARFNVENEPVEQAHQTFRGLPSPGAAGALASLVILHDNAYFFERSELFRSVARSLGEQGGTLSTWVLWTMPLCAMILGLLMVSRYHYIHIANRFLRTRRSISDIVRIFILVGVVVLMREVALCVLLMGYALSGPVLSAWQRMGGGGQGSGGSPHDASSPDADPPAADKPAAAADGSDPVTAG